MSSKPLDYENLNKNVKECQYAVRGELYLRASELQKEGKKVSFLCEWYMTCLCVPLAACPIATVGKLVGLVGAVPSELITCVDVCILFGGSYGSELLKDSHSMFSFSIMP